MEVAAFICETSLLREIKSSVKKFERGAPENWMVLRARSAETEVVLI